MNHRRPWRWTIAATTLAMVALPGWAWPAAADDALPLALRRPIAVVAAPAGERLYVAQRATGAVSVVDTAAQRVVGETPVGRRLSALLLVEPGLLAAVDEEAHELVFVADRDGQLQVVERLATPRHPVEATATRDGRRLFVACLWSQRLAVVERSAEGAPRVTAVVDLPFAPRKLQLTADERQLIVADAFAGQLGIFAVAAGELTQVRSLYAHNIRGLTLSPDGRTLLVSHQMLNDLATTVRNDVHWGLLMSNDLRWLRMESVLDPAKKLFDGGHLHPVGEARQGGGDPNQAAMSADGMVIVCLGATNQVAVGRENDFSLKKLAVGRRPTAVAIDPTGRRAYVANTNDDTLSIVDLAEREVVGQIEMGPSRPPTLAEKGEALFYSGALAHDGWMSCHSCHTDGHANGMLNDNFSDATFGDAKRVLSLGGLADTAPFAWNGSSTTLAEQLDKTIQHTMQRASPLGDASRAALEAYLHTLTPPPGIDTARQVVQPAAVERGRALFATLGCTECHAPPAYTTPQVYDVGLHDKFGQQEFNPPSLRGVSQRRTLFHDGRVASLEEALTKVRHQLSAELSAAERADLLAFLRQL